MTTFKTLNIKTYNNNGVKIILTTIEKTINATKIPFVNTYFKLSINGNLVGSHELSKSEVDFYIKNAKIYS